jgi:hypothetical protein
MPAAPRQFMCDPVAYPDPYDAPVAALFKPMAALFPPPALPALHVPTEKDHFSMKTQDLPTIGSPFQGGFFGGVIRLGVEPTAPLFAITWAPKAEGESTGAWAPTPTLVPGARSCFHSLFNTLAMAEAGSTLAKWALDLRINGHDDWCLPARDVLELAYRHLKPGTQETGCTFRDGDNASSVPAGYPYTEGSVVQTPVQAFQAGGAEAFDATWYWASTQYSESNAWHQGFGSGIQDYGGKKYEARARAVRLIQLTA